EFGGVTITLESADSEADEGFTVEEAPDARGGLRLMGGVLTGGDGHESAGDLGGAIGHCHVIEELELILGEGVDRGGGDCSAGLDSHAVTSSESVSVTLSALKRSPTLRTVWMAFSRSLPSFARRRRTCTSTARRPPK